MTDYDPLELLTVEEVMALLKVKRSWVYDSVMTGRLPKVKLGRSLRFRRHAIATYLESVEG